MIATCAGHSFHDCKSVRGKVNQAAALFGWSTPHSDRIDIEEIEFSSTVDLAHVDPRIEYNRLFIGQRAEGKELDPLNRL